jgi:hypothetical protein
VLELFFPVFPAKIPAKWGMPPVNRELRLAARVAVFLTHLEQRTKLQRARKNPRAKAIVREEKGVRFSARFPYLTGGALDDPKVVRCS